MGEALFQNKTAPPVREEPGKEYLEQDRTGLREGGERESKPEHQHQEETRGAIARVLVDPRDQTITTKPQPQPKLKPKPFWVSH